MLRSAREFFNSIYQENPDPKIIGLFLEVENEELKKLNQAYWKGPTSNWNYFFIGMDNKGSHMRVLYFENTEIY